MTHLHRKEAYIPCAVCQPHTATVCLCVPHVQPLMFLLLLEWFLTASFSGFLSVATIHALIKSHLGKVFFCLLVCVLNFTGKSGQVLEESMGKCHLLPLHSQAG